MPPQPDEYDALRTLVETLEPFEAKTQQQLLAWTQDRLGLASTTLRSPSIAPKDASVGGATTAPAAGGVDIKSFMAAKNPRSENQFAAAVAYYYQFEAPEAERKTEISKEDLITAARLSNRNRPNRPAQVLINSHHQGLLDKGSGAGLYRINSVGENLVAMVLPGDSNGSSASAPARKKKARSAPKKAAKKKAAKKGKKG